jgi:hypothetical protein
MADHEPPDLINGSPLHPVKFIWVSDAIQHDEEKRQRMKQGADEQ